jgi:hypothetical protein
MIPSRRPECELGQRQVDGRPNRLAIVGLETFRIEDQATDRMLILDLDAHCGGGTAARKSSAWFHAELLGDDEDDPFAYDLDMFSDLTPESQKRFLNERLQCTGKQNDFLKELLVLQHD